VRTSTGIASPRAQGCQVGCFPAPAERTEHGWKDGFRSRSGVAGLQHCSPSPATRPAPTTRDRPPPGRAREDLAVPCAVPNACSTPLAALLLPRPAGFVTSLPSLADTRNATPGPRTIVSRPTSALRNGKSRTQCDRTMLIGNRPVPREIRRPVRCLPRCVNSRLRSRTTAGPRASDSRP